MRFVPGLIVGLLLGSGGMYLALEKPWEGDASAIESDAGPAVAEDTGKKKKKRKKKRRKKRAGDVQINVGDDIPTLSAADRKLVWKGSAVALPPRTMDMDSGEDSRPLNSGEIAAGVRSQHSRMLGCITSARGNAQLKAKLIVKMLVDGNGRVKKTRVRAPGYLFAHGFYDCARKAASAMRFPVTGAHTVVDQPYELY